jgi:hypothetical protein
MHICTYQAITQQLHMLQPYFKQEMTQQTLLYLHLLELHASISNVISQPVQKLFDCTTYKGGKKFGRNVELFVLLHLIHNKQAHMHAHTHTHTTVGFGNQLQAATPLLCMPHSG